MQVTHPEHDVVLPERAIPRQRLLVAGVDERAVDVEERGASYGVAALLIGACSAR
jgi:hypothetical protein